VEPDLPQGVAGNDGMGPGKVALTQTHVNPVGVPQLAECMLATILRHRNSEHNSSK